MQAACDQQQEAAARGKLEGESYERSLRRLEGELQDEQARNKASAAAVASKDKELRMLHGQLAGLQLEAGERRIRWDCVTPSL